MGASVADDPAVRVVPLSGWNGIDDRIRADDRFSDPFF